LPSDPSQKPLKFGILGAANIAPNALILPARSHPEVVVYAVAARRKEKAEAFAKKYGIEKAYGSYEELISDPEVGVVYNPLPNMLHYEWTMKALLAGKHVLNEKPSADTAEETREMFDLAEEKGLVLLDAYHYRFHPAIHRVKEILESKEVGAIKNISVKMLLPGGFFGDDDIRFDYTLGGGAMMDLGCYAMNCIQYLSSSTEASVVSVTHEHFVPRSAPADYVKNVDRRTDAKLELANGVTASLTCDLGMPLTWGFIPKFPQIQVVVDCELGSIDMFNFVMPTLYHSITVKIRGGHTRVEKEYKGHGEEWWSTYRYQLDALVDRLRGRETKTWLSKEESVVVMEWIEQVYSKSGMGSRPRSGYIIST